LASVDSQLEDAAIFFAMSMAFVASTAAATMGAATVCASPVALAATTWAVPVRRTALRRQSSPLRRRRPRQC
jgi:hypothetical protein